MLIQLQNVTKEYKLGMVPIPALKGISISIEEGEFVAITGPSGSGKSTLLNIIGCLDLPTEGYYFLDGVDVTKLNDEKIAGIRNRHIGYVFQNFNLIPRMNVFENVKLPLVYSAIPYFDRRKRTENRLNEVGLGNRYLHQPNELSGGERQRVAIARALISEPTLLIADEPTGNLDTKTGKEIMDIFQRLNRKGITIILVTHEREVASYAQRIVKMRDGVIEVDERRAMRMEKSDSRQGEMVRSCVQNCKAVNRFKASWPETIKMAWASLWANRLRSWLMMLGMVIGVAAVIAVVAVGSAQRKIVAKEIETFGTNAVWVYRDWEDRQKDPNKNFWENPNQISNSDVVAIADKRIDLVTHLTPCLEINATARYGNKEEAVRIFGTAPSYREAGNKTVEKGRFILTEDLVNNRKVCVLSAYAKEKLFGKVDPLGKSLRIKNDKFAVVGLIGKEDRSFLETIGSVRGESAIVYLPLSVVQHWYHTQNVGYIQANAISANMSQIATNYLKEILTRRHKGRVKFTTETLQKYIKTSNRIMGTLTVVLGVIAGISLLVGGLGIMNIMLVSVTERTREIGIRKAIGARQQDIILQFVIESAVVGLIGGSIGIFLGLFGVGLTQTIAKVKGLFLWQPILVAFTVSLIVGLAAGVYPAQRAARLNPAETLRYE